MERMRLNKIVQKESKRFEMFLFVDLQSFATVNNCIIFV